MMSRPNQLMSKHNEECFWRPFDYVEDGGARARLIVSAESHTKATQGPTNYNALRAFKSLTDEPVRMSADVDIF